jgi:hypothetical protein
MKLLHELFREIKCGNGCSDRFYLHLRSECKDIKIGEAICVDITEEIKSRDSSVDIALGYGLEDWGFRVRFPAGAGNFSLHHRVQNGSWFHPASYPICTKDSFPGG